MKGIVSGVSGSAGIDFLVPSSNSTFNKAMEFMAIHGPGPFPSMICPRIQCGHWISILEEPPQLPLATAICPKTAATPAWRSGLGPLLSELMQIIWVSEQYFGIFWLSSFKTVSLRRVTSMVSNTRGDLLRCHSIRMHAPQRNGAPR